MVSFSACKQIPGLFFKTIHDCFVTHDSQVMFHNDTAIYQTEVEKVLISTDK